jgi:hypothetical protein
MDWKRWLLLITMAAAFAVAVLRYGELFQLTQLDFQSGLVITVFLMLAPSVIWSFERLFELGSQALGLWSGRRAGARERLAKR